MRGGLRVAVVGGSIAGCAAAVELISAGHRVSVHERTPEPLCGRGVGVVIDPVRLGRLVDHGLVDPDLPRVDAEVIRYVHRAPGADGAVSWIGDAVVPASAARWTALHHELRRRVPGGAYVSGHEVAAGFVGPEIRLEGLADLCDLVVFADGYRSAGRRLVAPEAEVGYRGMVVWRGLVPEQEADGDELDGARTRIMYPGGHGVARLIPGATGSTAPGERLVEWAFCLPLPAVPLGGVDSAVAAALRARLAPVLPAVHLDLVDKSPATALQAIVSVDVDRPHRARACLVGDAASVFPPFTGSGVLKAVDDAMTLRAALDRARSVPAALAEWGGQQRRLAETVRGIAHRNERELVARVPDLAAMSTAEKSQWLAALHHGDALRLPEAAAAPPPVEPVADEPLTASGRRS